METIALVVYWVSDRCMWAGHPVLNELVLSMFA